MIPPQLPGSPTYLKPGTPALAKFLIDLGYNTAEFGKNHLGDHTDALPTAHGFQEFWGYLYHLDAMQGVSFPTSTKLQRSRPSRQRARIRRSRGWPRVPYHWTQVVNIKRDPFETSIGSHTKTMFGMGGALASPSTAYVYDWNMLPIGQALWLKELESYIPFPPLQNPASYNLEQVMQQVREMKTASHAGE